MEGLSCLIPPFAFSCLLHGIVFGLILHIGHPLPFIHRCQTISKELFRELKILTGSEVQQLEKRSIAKCKPE